METEIKKHRVMIRNLGHGTHIFGAAFVHPNGDSTKQPVCACPLMELGPKGTAKDRIEMGLEQFQFYDDDTLKNKVESREYAVYLDGRDARPDLARKEIARATISPPTESDANKEQSVLAEILAEGDPKAE